MVNLKNQDGKTTDNGIQIKEERRACLKSIYIDDNLKNVNHTDTLFQSVILKFIPRSWHSILRYCIVCSLFNVKCDDRMIMYCEFKTKIMNTNLTCYKTLPGFYI